MENLMPNDGQGARLALWTPTLLGAATAPTGTYSATSGPDSTPGLTLASTGAVGGVEAVASVAVSPETFLFVSCILTASSATPTIIPIQVKFTDVNGNTVITATPVASAAATASAVKYDAAIGVPDGAVKATVILGALSWASVGGYTVILSSPMVCEA